MHTHLTPGTTLSDHYAALLSAQASSGLSMQRFAALHGVSACTLYLWRRRLSAAAPSSVEDGPRLVAVDVVGSARPADVFAAADRYEIQLANGLRLRVPTDFVAARVAELLSVLRTC
jgi:hypothetical protein